MPTIYKRYCNKCGKYYENQGDKYCSKKCGSGVKLGTKFTPQHIENIKKSHIGKKASQETKDLMSSQRKGVPKSELHKKHMSEAQTGEKNPNYGKHLSQEHINKIKIANSGKNCYNYGKPAHKGSGRGKRAYYFSPFQGQVYLRSSWELLYAQYLDKNNVFWLYEPKSFFLSDEMTYRPDFLLLKENKFIEIKGYLDEKHKIKINKFIKEYPNLKLEILYKEDLQKLGIKIK